MDVDEEAGAAAGGMEPPQLDASSRWPAVLRALVAGGVASRPAAMAALGGMLQFLKARLKPSNPRKGWGRGRCPWQ